MATQPNRGYKYHGGGEYAKVVFKHLMRNKKNAEVISFYNKNNYLDEDIAKIVKTNKSKLLHIEGRDAIQRVVSIEKIDKVYSALPYYLHGLNFGDLEFIYTIHGLRPIEMPTDRYEIKYAKDTRDIAKYVFKNILKRYYISMKRNQFKNIFRISKNRKIITPSQHSKYSLLLNFPELREDKIYVLYSPQENIVPISDPERLQDFGIDERKYFLIISANRWEKNALRAISALDKIFSNFPELHKKVLVLGVENNKGIKKVINRDRFIFYEYVDKPVLEMLYKFAYCFIYPTLNEGFGYPPLECMKYGTPAISSAISSITEICKDGVVYFNPFSIKEMENRILQLLFEPGIYERISQRGLEVSKTIAIEQDAMLDRLVNIILN